MDNDAARSLSTMTADEGQHYDVLWEAYLLFKDRSMFRGDMWRKFPISDKIRELRERVGRMEMIIAIRNVRPDSARVQMRQEAIDIINYATFIVKQLDEGADL